jgi:hypothetical protein
MKYAFSYFIEYNIYLLLSIFLANKKFTLYILKLFLNLLIYIQNNNKIINFH